MIFAVITGTPCLAIDNLSCKVSGVYNLMPKMKNVRICKNVDEVLENIEVYYYMDSSKEVDMSVCDEYRQLKNIIINTINE